MDGQNQGTNSPGRGFHSRGQGGPGRWNGPNQRQHQNDARFNQPNPRASNDNRGWRESNHNQNYERRNFDGENAREFNNRPNMRNIEEQPWRRNAGNNQNQGYSGGGQRTHHNEDGRGDSNQRQGRNYGPRNDNRGRRNVGFKYVEQLVNMEDVEELLSKLKKDQEGFLKLLNDPDLTDDLVVLIVKLVLKLCHGSFANIVKDVLNVIIQSKFVDRLMLYISYIIHQDSERKWRNKLFWNNTDEFWNNILQLSEKVLDIMPSITSETIKKILKNMKLYFPDIQETHGIQISNEIKAKTASLLEHVDYLIKQHESAKPERRKNTTNDMLEDPPDDFRDIPVIPAPLEVTQNISPFLRKNVIDQAYQSVNHYLDIQFRLLREDFVNPLRKGIVTYLENQARARDEKRKLENIRVYPQIQFLNVETVNECSCYKIRYDFSKKKKTFTYENSRRFMYGSLICFTNDNFQSLLFGKIVQRDFKLLEEGLLIVGFQENVEVLYESDYVMVESSVYFEPYYQVLNVLKKMKPEEFPMERYIIKIDRTSHPPEYLIKIDPVFFEIEDKHIMPLNWPRNASFYNLNASQLTAFEAALTQEFCIIQGPPGTGKTFLGLKIAHTLLQNRHAWYNRTPMLVICYTNHALDQFLEGLLPVTKEILRVGGQSKNENLQQFNIRNKKINVSNPAVFQLRKQVQESQRDIKVISDNLNHIYQNDSIVSFKVFNGVIDNYENTWFYNAKSDDIKQWLLEGKGGPRVPRPMPRNIGRQKNAIQELDIEGLEGDAEEDLEQEDREDNAWHDDLFDGVTVPDYKPLLHLDQLRTRADSLKEELLKLRNRPSLDSLLQEEKYQMEIWDTEQDLVYLERKLAENKDQRRWTPPDHVDLRNPKNMLPDHRWQLYFYWLATYYRRLRVKYEEASAQFRELFKVYNEMRDLDDAQVMKSSLVVGMTTTGAARLKSSLQALKSPIVIVEEAAEVLEAHIIAALTNHCKHLILIGDHEQLKPSAADYKIETKFHLGISLFERMVKNNIQCHTLNVQHRMRPDISRLIRPVIYPNLQDHESTLERLPISGIQKCIYFLDHQEQEELCQDNSKKNVYEAKFVIALARHLILNGYKPDQITVLAAYLGQMFEMLREKKKPLNNNLLKDVRIAVLDNYQGEESDIILLSLVRSNSEKKIGFLKIQNRVCVALSRARDGFYIVGNMKMLCETESENNIWHHVKQTLEKQNAIGPYLSLKCQIHLTQITQVSKAEDFLLIAEGGCRLFCEAQVSCGHICKRLCHVQDREHQLYKCREACNKPLCDTNPNHICKKMCYEDCGPCTYPVLRTLPECRHALQLSCYIDVNNYACKQLVLTTLPCDHMARKPCSDDPVTFKCPHPCDTRVEPCGHACDRRCHIRIDPDHLQYKCKEPCAKSKVGCTQIEERHTCTRYCFQDCESCDIGVQKTRRCSHVHTIACKLDVEEIECKRACKKILPCGHKCRNECSQPCGPCNEMVEKIISECGHKIRKKCHLEALKRECNSKICSTILPCGHKCKNECRKPCTTRCQETVNCALKSPCGHVVKKIRCYLRSTDDPKTLLKNCSELCLVTLKCNHKCSGTCGQCLQGRIHKRCDEKCGVPLVCNHECPNPCREACRPCTKKCEMQCGHSKCKKKCGEPCTNCAEPCTRNCTHVVCRNRCSQICNAEPCNVRCPKRLKCGHGCVGFCNDPCPNKCIVCDKDELTDIFLGREEEEDAIYVMLNDCRHIFESRDMEDWLNSDNGKDNKDQQVQLKVCPRCRTNITTTERYSKYAKQAMIDVIKVKEMAYGKLKENDIMRNELLEELQELINKCPRNLRLACPKIDQLLNALNVRLQPSRNQRRQPINLLELSAINLKLQSIMEMLDCFKDCDIIFRDTNPSIVQFSTILNALLNNEEHITKQEKEDFELETKRLERIIQLEKIENTQQFLNVINNKDVKTLDDNIREVLFKNRRYSEFLDNAVKNNLKELNKRTAGGLAITDRERREIVRALQQTEGIKRGSWFKCPNGHFYVIGECGGAEQFGKCIECNATIGGQQHRVVDDSRFAPEMDEATAPAWPGVHH